MVFVWRLTLSDKTVTVTIKATDAFSSVMQKYQTEIGKAASATKQADQANRQMAGSFDGLKTAIAGTIAAIGVQQVIGLASDMNELGVKVHANRLLFHELTKEYGDNASVMAMLRTETGNVIDDMTLMGETTRILRLGLADSAQGAGELIRMINQIKDPAVSTTEAIRNFSLMLSNESLLRLDTFGISSANVKRRMDELGQSFKEAALAEMAAQVKMLGPAADVSETALGRLQARVNNLAQAFSENLATGVEATLNLLEELSKHAAAGDLVPRLAGRSDEELFADRLRVIYQQERERMLINLTSAEQDSRNQSYAQLDPLGQQIVDQAETALAQSMVNADLAAGGEFVLPTDADNAVIQRMARLVTDTKNAWASATHSVMDYLAGVNTARQENERAAAAAEEQAAQQERITQEFRILGEMGQRANEAFYRNTGFDQQPRYITQGQANEVADQARYIEAEVERVKETFGDMLSDDQTRVLEAWVDNMRKFADQAQDAADAFQKMSLTDILGTTSGGVFGEIEDKVLALAQERGMSDERIAQIQQQLDMASGRQNNFSQAFNEQLVPTLVNLPPEQMATAIDNWIQSMQQARLTNLPQDFMARDINSFAGLFGTGGGQQVTVNPGDDTYSVAARYGVPREQIAALMQNGVLRTGSYQVGGGGQLQQGFDPQAFVTMQGHMFDMFRATGEDFTAVEDSSTQVNDDFAEVRVSSEGTLANFTDILKQSKDTLMAVAAIHDKIVGGTHDKAPNSYGPPEAEPITGVNPWAYALTPQFDAPAPMTYNVPLPTVDWTGVPDTWQMPAPDVQLTDVPDTVDMPAPAVQLTNLPQSLDVPLPPLNFDVPTADASIPAPNPWANAVTPTMNLGVDFGAEQPMGYDMPTVDTQGAQDFANLISGAYDSMMSVATSASETDVTFAGMVDSATQLQNALSGAGELLDDIFSKKYTLTLDAVAPDWLKALILRNGLDLGSAIAEVVRGNGGNVPGQQAQGRSTRVVER